MWTVRLIKAIDAIVEKVKVGEWHRTTASGFCCQGIIECIGGAKAGRAQHWCARAPNPGVGQYAKDPFIDFKGLGDATVRNGIWSVGPAREPDDAAPATVSANQAVEPG